MSADAERRSRLLALKLRALVRGHLGLDADPEGTPGTFGPGAVLVTADAVWVLVDGSAARSLGGALAWALKHGRPLHLLAEFDSGVLARRARYFDHPVSVWHVEGTSLLPAIAEPHLPIAEPSPAHLHFVDLIVAGGAEPVIEHGTVTGEVRGLEMCRVVDDAHTGVARLEVGMGAHDREAFAMVHGELPTEEAVRQVVEAVEQHRSPGADPHPLNTFGAERFHRWRAIADPASFGADSVVPADPPALRTNLKDPVPCAAIAESAVGRSLLTFVHGIDLDVVPFALDAADRHGVGSVVIVARERDIVASIRAMADVARTPVSFRPVGEQ